MSEAQPPLRGEQCPAARSIAESIIAGVRDGSITPRELPFMLGKFEAEIAAFHATRANIQNELLRSSTQMVLAEYLDKLTQVQANAIQTNFKLVEANDKILALEAQLRERRHD